jgi:hypothetical protein
MILRFNKKADLIAALAAKRPVVQALDAKALAAHKAEEKAYYDAFRAACREAAKWSLEEAKKNNFVLLDPDGCRFSRGPACPRSMEGRLDRIIGILGASNQERYSISDDGHWSDVWKVLTIEAATEKAVC